MSAEPHQPSAGLDFGYRRGELTLHHSFGPSAFGTDQKRMSMYFVVTHVPHLIDVALE